MKKFLVYVLIMVMTCMPMLSFAETFAVDAEEPEEIAINLAGFSYNMGGDSSMVEEGFSLNGKIFRDSEKLTLQIAGINAGDMDIAGDYALEDLGDNIYQATLPDGKNIIVDLTDDVQVDIIDEDIVYAFGGNREDKVKEILDEEKASQETEKSAKPGRRAKARVKNGLIASAQNNKALVSVYFEKDKSNKLSFAIQTLSVETATKVISVDMDGETGGTTVHSLNPSGASGGVDWASSIVAVAGRYSFFVPVYFAGTTSSCWGDSFEFHTRIGCDWNKMRAKNATMLIVYLDSTPDSLSGCYGEITISYRIPSVGSFQTELGVYV